MDKFEKALQDQIKKHFKSVKSYSGELDKESILTTSAGTMPAALVFISSIRDGDTLDQEGTELVEATIIIIVHSLKNPIHDLRRKVKKQLNGCIVDGRQLTPLQSKRYDAIAITPTVSIYAMVFECEMTED